MRHGNLPHIMSRIKAHQKALNAVLHTGAARNHRGNPAANIRIEKRYATPKLLSGIGALVLLKSEANIIDHHLKEIHEQLMRLHPSTPQPVVCFLAGCLPGTALVDLRILSNFGMICSLKESILHKHAIHVLVQSKPSSRSWFVKVRDLCLQYGLPHPLIFLQSNYSKDQYKSMVKKAVVDYSERKLRADAEPPLSLEYFKPEFMSLTTPHPMWTTAGSCSYQISMCTIQAIMVSGRYRTELLCSKWSPQATGNCITPSCLDSTTPEDLHPILAVCGSLQPTRERLASFSLKISGQFPAVKHLIDKYCTQKSPQFVQFLLDCSVLPDVILAKQKSGSAILEPLFRISRTWCYSLHRSRLKIIDRWKKFKL